LLNVTQQISSSIGVAVMSVILTNHFNNSDLARPAMAAIKDPAADHNAPNVVKGIADAGAAFADTYWVALVLVALTLIPVFFLPRKREESHLLDDEGAPPVMVH
jgi:hypothetical protein